MSSKRDIPSLSDVVHQSSYAQLYATLAASTYIALSALDYERYIHSVMLPFARQSPVEDIRVMSSIVLLRWLFDTTHARVIHDASLTQVIYQLGLAQMVDMEPEHLSGARAAVYTARYETCAKMLLTVSGSMPTHAVRMCVGHASVSTA